MKDGSQNIRSSEFERVISINTAHELNVIQHEFGHGFANFAEEYRPAKIPQGSKNCQSSCENFNGEIDGCFQECSEANYYRSIENGVMRTLSSNQYGLHNEKLILEQLAKQYKAPQQKLTGNAISNIEDCQEQQQVLIELVKNEKGEVIGKKKEVIQGCGPSELGQFDSLLFTDAPGEIIQDEINGETFEATEIKTYAVT